MIAHKSKGNEKIHDIEKMMNVVPPLLRYSDSQNYR